jgi:hypothetical protein
LSPSVDVGRRPILCCSLDRARQRVKFKVKVNDRVNVHVAVKLNAGVDVEVMVKVDDPSDAADPGSRVSLGSHRQVPAFQRTRQPCCDLAPVIRGRQLRASDLRSVRIFVVVQSIPR